MMILIEYQQHISINLKIFSFIMFLLVNYVFHYCTCNYSVCNSTVCHCKHDKIVINHEMCIGNMFLWVHATHNSKQYGLERTFSKNYLLKVLFCVLRNASALLFVFQTVKANFSTLLLKNQKALLIGNEMWLALG